MLHFTKNIVGIQMNMPPCKIAAWALDSQYTVVLGQYIGYNDETFKACDFIPYEINNFKCFKKNFLRIVCFD